MFQKSSVSKRGLVALSLGLLLASACQPQASQPTQPAQPGPSSAPADPNAIAINLNQGRQQVAGQLMDAARGELVTAPTRIRVTGPGAAMLEQTELSTQNGLLALTLKANVKPSRENPLRLTLVAEAEGYFTGSVQLQLDDAREAFVVRLTDRSNPPQGVGTASDSSAQASNGTLTQAIDLQASTQGVNARFALPNGSTLTDASGQPLSGQLQTHVGYFSNLTPESLNAFPGGFAPDSVSNSPEDEGYFVTGGFVSVDITDSSGKKAANFSQSATVTIQIPAGTPNPDTGLPVKAGDTIPIWSHSTQTGQWSLEGQGTVAAGSNGNFDVTYAVSHLSYWNLDWFMSDRCNPQLNLNWDSENHVPVLMELLMDDENWYTHSNILQDPVNHLYNVPVGKEMTFVAKYLNQEVGREVVTLNQSCQPITVDIQTSGLPALRTVPLQVSLGSQTRFTRAEVENLASRFGLNNTLIQNILAYTHPTDPTALFAFDDAAYAELKRLGVNDDQLQMMRSLLDQTYRPTMYIGYYQESDPWGSNWVSLEEGQGQVTLAEGQDYTFYGHIYYNDRYFWINQTLRLEPGQTELRLDIRDVDLTLEVVRTLLGQIGISLPNL
ncbi:MAG: hypothetical protein IGS03_15590 [Candidatus Sericytochromatia bacterium]|nr:hypothetical protein [Candidatus Sericytochromatia bacterium]